MSITLKDGTVVAIAYDDLRGFFDSRPIIGQKIVDIIPSETDYMIRYPGDLDGIWEWETECGIQTDGTVSLIFESGDVLEIDCPGEAPFYLGFNVTGWDGHPQTEGLCYPLRVMFRDSIGRKVESVEFERSPHRMIFPTVYLDTKDDFGWQEVDMSADDDGVKKLRFCLDDGTQLVFAGSEDWFDVIETDGEGREHRIPYRALLESMSSTGREELLRIWKEHEEN